MIYGEINKQPFLAFHFIRVTLYKIAHEIKLLPQIFDIKQQHHQDQNGNDIFHR